MTSKTVKFPEIDEEQSDHNVSLGSSIFGPVGEVTFGTNRVSNDPILRDADFSVNELQRKLFVHQIEQVFKLFILNYFLVLFTKVSCLFNKLFENIFFIA